MSKQPGDRRARRSRQLLQNALFDLMLEKRYDHITIQDIIDRADVGRSTFYAHFQDKEDLATQGLESVMEQISHSIASKGTEPTLVSTVELFRHMLEHQQLFRAIARGRGIDLFLEKGQAYWNKQIQVRLGMLVPKGRKPNVSLVLLSSYLTGTLVTLFKWWLDNKMPYSPERMDEIFQQLVTPGVQGILEH